MVYKMLIDLLAEGKLAIEGKFHFRWISLQVKFRGNPEGLGLRDHARSIWHGRISLDSIACQ